VSCGMLWHESCAEYTARSVQICDFKIKKNHYDRIFDFENYSIDINTNYS
jgi:hypothetical protein